MNRSFRSRVARRWPALWLAAFALLLAVSPAARVGLAQPRPTDRGASSPVAWRAFRPLVIAFGEGDPCAAVAYLRAAHELARKADGDIERDAVTRAFQRDALASIADFDLKKFYQLLPHRDGPFHTFSYEGAPLPRGYRFNVGRGPSYEVHAAGSRREFGDLSGTVRMRHLEADDRFRYLMEFRAGAGIGALSFDALERGFADGLALLEERPDPATLPLLVQTLASRLKREQPNLRDEDRTLLAQTWASFPELVRMLLSITKVEDLVAADAQDGATSVRAALRIDLAGLTRAYPALAAFLRRFGNLLSGRARVSDTRGLTWAELSFDSGTLRAQLQFYVRGGELVPSRAGVVMAPGAVADPQGMHVEVDMHLQQYGLHMFLDKLRVELQGERHATGASLSVQIKQTPRFRAEGSVFGLFPAGMLDWFVPGDIEGLARRMLDVTMKGNGGKGVLMRVRLERPAHQLGTIDGSAGFEILDTALIRFGMRIAADRVMPDDAAEDELGRLVRTARDALIADLDRFAQFAPEVLSKGPCRP